MNKMRESFEPKIRQIRLKKYKSVDDIINSLSNKNKISY
jgi:hypothetical protein